MVNQNNYEIPEGYEATPEEDQHLPLSEVLRALIVDHCYVDCTAEANEQNGPGYEVMFAFVEPNNGGVVYCNDEDDVRELWYTVE